MKMTVYFDGAFWAALIEYVDIKGQYKAFRYVFGKEPKDEDILTFIYRDLGKWQSRCAHIDTHIEAGSSALSPKKSNPKRIQREINRAKKKPITSTKAQMAMQEIHDSLKKSVVLKTNRNVKRPKNSGIGKSRKSAVKRRKDTDVSWIKDRNISSGLLSI